MSRPATRVTGASSDVERIVPDGGGDLAAEAAGLRRLVQDDARDVLRTDASTASRSQGSSVRRSMTSIETPSRASVDGRLERPHHADAPA